MTQQDQQTEPTQDDWAMIQRQLLSPQMLDLLAQVSRDEARIQAREQRPPPPAGRLYFDVAAALLSKRMQHDAGAAAAARAQLGAAIAAGHLAAISARTGLKVFAGATIDLDDCLVSMESLQALTGQDLTPPHAKGKRWTDEEVAKLAAYKDQHGTKKAAEHFNISEALVRKKCNGGHAAPKTWVGRTHRIR